METLPSIIAPSGEEGTHSAHRGCSCRLVPARSFLPEGALAPDPQASTSQCASICLLTRLDSFPFLPPLRANQRPHLSVPVFCVPLFIRTHTGTHTWTRHSATSSLPGARGSQAGLGAQWGSLMLH